MNYSLHTSTFMKGHLRNMPKQETYNFAWNLTVELRKELVELQRLRAQVVGFKITFVSTATAVIAANLDKVPIQLLVIPSFAAIFFDFLISSYSNSIKRIGLYCHEQLGGILKNLIDLPDKFILWEEYLRKPPFGQKHAITGNLGITGLSIAVAIISLLTQFNFYLSTPLIIVVLGFFIYDIVEMRKPSKK